ncbi:MAG: hypothetical protein LW860_05135 [Xanthomonadaceae bacterium]|jgi:hypothetical protein|nr:hypothetical protein [Xanthomonadaceae bacterium]
MPNPIVTVVLARLRNLRFPTLALLTAGLFVLTLVIPDPLPFADELLLGLLALMFANWKRERGPPPPDRDLPPP